MAISDGLPVSQQVSQPAETLRENPSGPMVPAQEPASPPTAAPAQPIVNVSTVVNGPTIVIANQQTGPGFLVRALWFFFVGWYVTFFWIIVSWLLVLSVVGIPLGVAMLNRIPKVLTLKPNRTVTSVTTQNGVITIGQANVQQLPFLARAVYFVLVGSWLSFVWLLLAYLLSLTIVLLPVSLLMFDKSPVVVSLRRQ